MLEKLGPVRECSPTRRLPPAGQPAGQGAQSHALVEEAALAGRGEGAQAAPASTCCAGLVGDTTGSNGHGLESGFPLRRISGRRVVVDPSTTTRPWCCTSRQGAVVVSAAPTPASSTARCTRRRSPLVRCMRLMGGFHLTGPIFEPRIEPPSGRCRSCPGLRGAHALHGWKRQQLRPGDAEQFLLSAWAPIRLLPPRVRPLHGGGTAGSPRKAVLPGAGAPWPAGGRGRSPAIPVRST